MLTRACLLRLLVCFLLCSLPFSKAISQLSVSEGSPFGLVPGIPTQLDIVGKDLTEPLRLHASVPCEFRILAVEPTKASIEATVDKSVSSGPFGIWIATQQTVSDPFLFVVDDLRTFRDVGDNHTPEKSQRIELPCAIDGRSEASKTDYYQFAAAKDSLWSIDVVAQRMGSSLDSVIQIFDTSGQLMAEADDTQVGPDSQIQFRAPRDGEYRLSIRDNRYQAGGRYRLRFSSQPISEVAYPPVVPRMVDGQQVQFLMGDGSSIRSRSFHVSTHPFADRMSISSPDPGARWHDILVRDVPIVVEPMENVDRKEPMDLVPTPCAIAGRLVSSKEVDNYWMTGTKGQAIRVVCYSRSLGSPAMLRVELYSEDGKKVAESAVTDQDEPTLDVTFPESGKYQLRCFDILGRGGPTYVYCVELQPKDTFALSLKADAKSAEQKLLEETSGAIAWDLVIQRLGYDGPIVLNIAGSSDQLRLLNPVVPAKAAAWRLFLNRNPAQSLEQLIQVQLVGRKQEGDATTVPVKSTALRKLKEPNQPFPPSWRDGVFVVAPAASSEPMVGLDAFKAQMPRPLAKQDIIVPLKRLKGDFKEPLELSPEQEGVDGWKVARTLEKDQLKISLERDGKTDNPWIESIPVALFCEYKGRGRIDHLKIPVDWYQPLEIEVDSPKIAAVGGMIPVRIHVKRTDELSQQAVEIVGGTLPTGVSLDGVTLQPGQSEAYAKVHLANNSNTFSSFRVPVVARSKLRDIPIEVEASSREITLIPPPIRWEAHPQSLSFLRVSDKHQIVVTGWDSQGSTRDWTHDAIWSTQNPEVATVDRGVVTPKGDGKTAVVAAMGPHRLEIPVSIEGVGRTARVEFENEVLVALSKQGCNSGACHGSPSGKGSFRLSLRAFDAVLDSHTLVREEFGRRINTHEPEQSLLLKKPLMKVPHGGGMQLHKSDPAYSILREWIAQGAPLDPPDASRCVNLEVYPRETRTLQLRDGVQQLSVVARFADGRTRDVTHIASYDSSNTSVATVSKSGWVQGKTKGEAVILVRYLEHIQSIPFLFTETDSQFEWKPQPTVNFVDVRIDEKLRVLQINASPICSDEVFLRRVYLDVLGILPTVEETVAFLKDGAEDKRSRLIDKLLERPEYAKFWALKWGDLLRLTAKNVSDEGVYKFYRWIEKSFESNLPVDEFARQLIAASGSTFTNPPANFYRAAGDMNDCVETISQVFMGARLQCAKCHNHPFEKWTQDNYYGLGAFFQRVQRKKTQRPNEFFVWGASTGDTIQPRTKQIMKPWVPGGVEETDEDSGDRRIGFVNWLVQKENPFFARVEANRIWSQLFARGIVDPIDDFRDSNPPTNRPLLDDLAKFLVDSGYDRKALLKLILRSRTYQASYEPRTDNSQDLLYFSHQEPRLLGAEQLLDAINQLTNTEQSFGNLPKGTRATQLPAPDLVKVDFLKTFGQPDRATVCACERSEDSNLGMAIELFNGSTVYEKLRNPNNRFRKAVADGKALEEIIGDLYLAGLSRFPSEEEIARAKQHCESKEDPIKGLEDLCWALINTDEFLFQH